MYKIYVYIYGKIVSFMFYFMFYLHIMKVNVKNPTKSPDIKMINETSKSKRNLKRDVVHI